ncbi:hypothetical protein [Adhaeribacter swui]|nr:hypothetical protein [Adhaeribacter swui]
MLPELLAVAPITRFEVFGNLSKEAAEAVQHLGATIFRYHAGFVREASSSEAKTEEMARMQQ